MFQGEPLIWFNRDEEGYLLLNLRMLSTGTDPRLTMDDAFWTATGNPTDFECPPSGKLIDATYANGDRVRIEFLEFRTAESLEKRYPDAYSHDWEVEFPTTAVEIHLRVGGEEFELGPRATNVGNRVTVQNNFLSEGKCLHIR